MNEIRKRFKKETSKNVGIKVDFECEHCGIEDGVEGWSDDYVFWLEQQVKNNDCITDVVGSNWNDAYKECFELYIPTDKWDEATKFLSTYDCGLAKELLKKGI